MENQSEQIVKMQKAGFLIRFLASCIDGLFILTLFLIAIWMIDLGNKGIRDFFLIFLGLLVFLFFFYFLRVIYFSLTTSFFGGTLGKLAAGLEVVDEKGRRLKLARSFFRHLIGYPLAGSFLGLGFFWIIRDQNKQGWHDQLTGSYVVVKRKSGAILALLFLFLFLIFDGYMVVKITEGLQNNQVLKKEIENIKKSYEDIERQEVIPTPFSYQEI